MPEGLPRPPARPGGRLACPAPARAGIPPAQPPRCYLGTSSSRASRKPRAVGKLNKEARQGFSHHQASLRPSHSKRWAQVQVRACLITDCFFQALIPSAASTVPLPQVPSFHRPAPAGPQAEPQPGSPERVRARRKAHPTPVPQLPFSLSVCHASKPGGSSGGVHDRTGAGALPLLSMWASAMDLLSRLSAAGAGESGLHTIAGAHPSHNRPLPDKALAWNAAPIELTFRRQSRFPRHARLSWHVAPSAALAP